MNSFGMSVENIRFGDLYMIDASNACSMADVFGVGRLGILRSHLNRYTTRSKHKPKSELSYSLT